MTRRGAFWGVGVGNANGSRGLVIALALARLAVGKQAAAVIVGMCP
jgi:hypothetical protein